MATVTREITVAQATKVIKLSRLSVLLLFFMALMMYMLTQITDLFGSLVFYGIFMLFVFQYSHVISYLQNRRRFLLSLADYDITDAFPPAIIWGFGAFFLFGMFHLVVGSEVAFPNMDTLVNQLFIASSETFIFCVFLPEAVGEYYGRIPFTKVRIPGWFWGAGFFFGTFHLPAYMMYSSSMLGLGFNILIAIFMGLGFYTLYKYGEKNKRVGGVSAAISLHLVWNIWALSTLQILVLVL